MFQKYAMLALFENYFAAIFPSNYTDVVKVLSMSHFLSQLLRFNNVTEALMEVGTLALPLACVVVVQAFVKL